MSDSISPDKRWTALRTHCPLAWEWWPDICMCICKKYTYIYIYVYVEKPLIHVLVKKTSQSPPQAKAHDWVPFCDSRLKMGKLSARIRGNKANLDVPSTHPMEAVYTKIVVRQDNLNLCLVHTQRVP